MPYQQPEQISPGLRRLFYGLVGGYVCGLVIAFGLSLSWGMVFVWMILASVMGLFVMGVYNYFLPDDVSEDAEQDIADVQSYQVSTIKSRSQ